MSKNKKRSGTTRKKTITLTDDGREQIQAFAAVHQMTFSAAIETLALIGMEADLSSLLIPTINNAVEKGLKRQFNRMAKLTLLAAAEAAMAHDLSTMLLLQQVRQTAAEHPQNFEAVMSVSQDPNHGMDQRIRAIYQKMRRIARRRQQKLLRQSLPYLVAQLEGEAVDIAVAAKEVDDDNE